MHISYIVFASYEVYSIILTSISITLPMLRSVGEGLAGTDPPPEEREPGNEGDDPAGKEGDGREEGKGGRLGC